MRNEKVIRKVNNLLPWVEKEGDSDGYHVTDPADAFANFVYAIKVINELDGLPHEYKESTAQAVGDLSVLLVSIPTNLQSIARLHPSFNLVAENKDQDAKDLLFEEIYQIHGISVQCGQYMLYHQEISKKDHHPHAGRILRLTKSDWAKLFW